MCDSKHSDNNISIGYRARASVATEAAHMINDGEGSIHSNVTHRSNQTEILVHNRKALCRSIDLVAQQTAPSNGPAFCRCAVYLHN